MDSIESINIKKDSSFAILLKAQKRNYKIYYMKIKHLYKKNNIAYANSRIIKVYANNKKWFKYVKKKTIILNKLNVILMRKNPPVNLNFIYSTYILDNLKKTTLLINNAKHLRNYNEKLITLKFPNIIPKTLISKKYKDIKKFLKKEKDIILKPMNEMGGSSIFRVQNNDINSSVIIENMTKNQKKFCIAQKFIPEIKNGDRRILIINNKVIPYCLCRIPKKGEIRGNLAAGGKGKVEKISKKHFKIIQPILKFLKKKKIFFSGLDLIGNKLTEINITSPTGIQEIEKYSKFKICSLFLNELEKLISKN